MIKISQLELAKYIAEKAFANKKDKGGNPYMNHINYVVSNSVRCGGNSEEVQTVAYLHDLLEDCPEWNESTLRVLFTTDVVDAVVLLTKKPDQSYPEYIAQLADNVICYDVKLADLKHNLDVSRLHDKELNQGDLNRLNKYLNAYSFLLQNS